MKSVIFPSIVLIAASLAGCQNDSSTFTSADRANIEAASKVWVETYNRNDWEGLSELFTVDAVMMPPNGPIVTGREAIAAWEADNETGFRIGFEIDAIEGSGIMAYVRGRSCVFIPDGAGGYGVDVGKFLEVRRRQSDGTWLIEADSFNSDLGIGSALLDSCPLNLSDE